jgi:putative DNA primase/helicase
MAAANYDDVLQQLRAAGLLIDRLEVGTPRPVRCRVDGAGREKRGWYRLHELHADSGDLLIVGSFGVWRGSEPNTTNVELRRSQLSKDQAVALRKRLAEDRKAAEQILQREQARAADRASSMWARLQPEGDADYLDSKHVAGYGLRYTENGTAVVPLLDTTGRIHGLQFLRTAAQARTGERPAKEFWPAGLAKRGHFHLIGSPSWVVLVAEGYATAATLHMATGHPVAVAFDAGNLHPVAEALRKRYRGTRILICADDDTFGHCHAKDAAGKECRARVSLTQAPRDCPACGEPHRVANAGVSGATTAAMAVDGSWLVPRFADPAAREHEFLERGHKRSDFNDLHVDEGLHVVRVQVEAHLSALRWHPSLARPSSSTTGEGGDGRLRPIEQLDELLERYALVYGANGAVFDRREHCLVPLADMRNACIRKALHQAWMEHPDRAIVRMAEVGFDPAETNANITCNLWGGWPTEPKAGSCALLLELLQYVCSADENGPHLFDWVLKWLAYPIQHPGAKMKTTIVAHGPQGAGKNMFFEAVMSIYGQYGRILDQDALVDKHNDWASRKLFLIADEVVAQAHRFELKNKLKTLITGTWIRINPKHIAAYDEENHCNLVFLSNENMPVVLEEDDRRHCVIWTPEEREADFYRAVLREIQDGGVAALHDYLLHLDLGDFGPGTRPPNTRAKSDLIELAQDSPLEWFDALLDNGVGCMKPIPGLTQDWYTCYTRWCGQVGIKPASLKRWQHQLTRRRHAPAARKRYTNPRVGGEEGPHSVITWRKTPPEGVAEREWLGEQIAAMKDMLGQYRGTAG